MKKTTYMNTTILSNETGRSMVEMLGVLAIIGVLSVGGISAYSTAMDKHKANEALHKASMLATTVSAYAMTNDGNLPSSITDFGSASNGTFETTVGESADKTQFKLTMKGVGSDICKQMQSSMGGIVQGVECDETTGNATITYYKNLATSKEQGEADGSLNGSCTESSDKCDGGTYYVCENGTWVSRSAPAGTACNGDTLELSDTCNGAETTCLNGTSYICTGGSWVPGYDCCEGNTPVYTKCENGTYYRCSSGSWVTDYGCCNGNTPVSEGDTATINGVTKVCSDGGWLEGCNNGNVKCENGTHYLCSGDLWVTGYGGCCNGNTPVRNAETATINGVTKMCSFGEWI